ANPRSTVGTVTDANALLRILFSRLGQPYIGPSPAFSCNIAAGQASGAITVERGPGSGKTEERTVTLYGGMCPRCEGMGRVTDFDLTALYDADKSLNEGGDCGPAAPSPGGTWTTGLPSSRRCARRPGCWRS